MFKGVWLVFFLTVGIQVLASENTYEKVKTKPINNCLKCSTISCFLCTSVCCINSFIYLTEDKKIVSENQKVLPTIDIILKNQKMH